MCKPSTYMHSVRPAPFARRGSEVRFECSCAAKTSDTHIALASHGWGREAAKEKKN